MKKILSLCQKGSQNHQIVYLSLCNEFKVKHSRTISILTTTPKHKSIIHIANKIDEITKQFKLFDEIDKFGNAREYKQSFDEIIQLYLQHTKVTVELLKLVKKEKNETLQLAINEQCIKLNEIYLFKLNIAILKSRDYKKEVINVLNKHSKNLTTLEGAELELATCLEIVKQLPNTEFSANLCNFINKSIHNSLFLNEYESIANLSNLLQKTLDAIQKEPAIPLKTHQREIIAQLKTQLPNFIAVLKTLKSNNHTTVLVNKLFVILTDCFGDDLSGIQQLRFLSKKTKQLTQNIIQASLRTHFSKETKIENTQKLLDQILKMAENNAANLIDINKLIYYLQLFTLQHELSSNSLEYFIYHDELNKKEFFELLLETALKKGLIPEEIKTEVAEHIERFKAIEDFNSEQFNAAIRKHLDETNQHKEEVSLKKILIDLDLSLDESNLAYAKRLISNLDKLDITKLNVESKHKRKQKKQKAKKTDINWNSLANELTHKMSLLNANHQTTSEDILLAETLISNMKELHIQQEQQAQKIQKTVKIFLAKKKLLTLKILKKTQASTTIQSIFRQYSAKKRVKYLKQEKSAIKIQTIFRQYHAVQKSKLIKQEKSAIKIQTNMKLWLSKNLAHSLKPLLALKSHINSHAAELKIEDTAANLNSAIKNYISFITKNPSIKANPIIKELMPKCLESHERFLSLCKDQADFKFETVHLLHLLRSVNSYFNTKEIISSDEVLEYKKRNLSKQDIFIKSKMLQAKKDFLVSELSKSSPYPDSPEKILYVDWLNKSLFKLRQLHTHYMHPKY